MPARKFSSKPFVIAVSGAALFASVSVAALLVSGCAGGDGETAESGDGSGGSSSSAGGNSGAGGGLALGGSGGKSDGAKCGDELDLEGCSCPAGTAARACYPGSPAQAGKGACVMGTQTCTGGESGELGFGVWGPCTGAGTPKTCGGAGVSCGPASDGCGGQLDCGVCAKCTPGSVTLSTPGTFDFEVQEFQSLTVEVWGAGGGADGGFGSDAKATPGGSSSFHGTLVAGGGAAGHPAVPLALGGTASGGDTNIPGGPGGNGCYTFMVLCAAGVGGDAPPAGIGGKGGPGINHLDACHGYGGGDGQDGATPGGGGHGAWSCQHNWPAGQGWGYGGAAGGGGAYAKKVYAKGQLAPGKVAVVVGAGGVGAKGAPTSFTPGLGKNPGYYTGGNGGTGQVKITWTCP